jgi:hypothetical protein
MSLFIEERVRLEKILDHPTRKRNGGGPAISNRWAELEQLFHNSEVPI